MKIENITEEEQKQIFALFTIDTIDFLKNIVNKIKDAYKLNLANKMLNKNFDEPIEIAKELYYIKGKIDLLSEFNFFIEKLKEIKKKEVK